MSKNIKAPFGKSALLAALVAGGSMVASADAPSAPNETLLSWAKDASVAVDDVMVFPHMMRTQTRGGTVTFEVTVDDDGNVLDSDVTNRVRNIGIMRAARKVVKKVALPDLPEGYDELTFELRLTYAIEPTPFMAPARSGRVKTQQIADKDGASGPLTAGLRIISVTADSE